MRRAEALAGGGDRVERVAGDLEAVLGHRRIEADVAVAAAFCFLSEVGEQHAAAALRRLAVRSEEHTSELQSLMRISYAVFCLKKKKKQYLYTQRGYHTVN